MSNAAEQKQWYALYTKPRSEKKLAERLQKQGRTVYLPLKETMREWSDRKKKILVPVLPSYLFLKINFQKEHLDILREPAAAFFIYWLGKPAAISDDEIAEMKNFLEENENVQLEDIDEAVGKEVRITHGPMQNKRGTVLRASRNKVHLQLFALGMQLTADVHPSKIEFLKSNPNG